jgi:hypothetical protein
VKKEAVLLEEKEVLERQPVTLTVTGRNRSVLNLLESLANTSPDKQSPHFFVIRALRVENEKKDAPSKGVTVQVDEKEETLPDGTKATVKRDAQYLLGNEKVKMSLELDVIRFADLPAAPEKGKPAETKTAAN